MLLLRTYVRVMLFAACSTALAAGCGGLRRFPINGEDGGPGGIGGSSANAGRGGGSAGGAGTTGNGGGIAGTTGSGGMGGSTTVVDAGGIDAPTCVSGGACVPANPCHKGMFVCLEGGAMSCMELTDLQSNGTVCDTDKVCRNGSCESCVQGMACDVTGKPCRVGSIVCATGSPVCTETDNKPNGTTCGTGMVCQAGTCATCQAGGACTPTNKCHTGTLVCSGASPSCTDTGTAVAPGTSCGTDMVCGANGTCASCVQGMDCVVPGKPCRKGTIACNTGTPVCIESGDVANGTVCGANQVCSGGNCAACSAGSICVPANPCHAGITVCSPNIGCTDTGNALANGAGCGTDRVCNAGTCVSCAAGASCQPTNACKTGTPPGATGSPVCVESGNKNNGTSCGANMVCNAGSCATCSAGTACTPTNPCHTGTLNCSTGTPTCTDSGASQTDGTSCGTNLVCKGGSCVSCVAGQACQPANACKTGVTSCATGVSTCVESGNKGQGTQCGPAQSCSNGVVTMQGLCTATGTCLAATTQCTNGCNTAGTDCANCPSGQTSCPAGCRDLTRDPGNCGQCGNACPNPPVGGIAVCASSTCGVQCNPGFLQCVPASLGLCQQTLWDFEDMTLGGYRVINSPSAAGKLGYTSLVQHSGKYALGAVIRATGTTRGYQIGPPFCGAAARSYVQGKTITVSGWMMIEPSDKLQTFGKASYWGIRITTESGDTLAKGAPRGYNEWFPVSVTAPAGDNNLSALVLEGVFTSDDPLAPGDWTGNMYFDDIQITVP
jgi:hypothetical protein